MRKKSRLRGGGNEQATPSTDILKSGGITTEQRNKKTRSFSPDPTYSLHSLVCEQILVFMHALKEGIYGYIAAIQ
jgi:hypothetical protein